MPIRIKTSEEDFEIREPVQIDESKPEIEKFKDLLMDMYRGYPGYYYINIVEKYVKSKQVIKELVRQDVLSNFPYSPYQHSPRYMLGATGVQLVVAWKNEELSRHIKRLTAWLIFLTAVLIFMTGYLIYIAL